MKTTLKNIIILIATQMTLISVAQAQQPSAPAKPAPRSSDRVDLKKLEEKYWSAKDDDYSVVQNRTFSKEGKFFVSAVYGPVINDPFATSRMAGAILGYYFNEDFGVEANYFFANSKKNKSVEEFNSLNAFGVSPDYNLPGNSATVSLSYTPFYAKMAFMNKSILYFDMGFTAGLGMTEYNQVVRPEGATAGEEEIKQSSPHFEIGIVQQLFLTKNFAFRLDLKNTFYNKKTVSFQKPGPLPRLEKSSTDYNTTVTFGLTLFTN